MKIAIIIARILLGAIFFVFGLNGFFQFIPVPDMPPKANDFMALMVGSGWLSVVKVLEITGGLALLTGRWIPLGLTILGPVVVNIILFHIFLAPAGMGLAIVTLVLEIFLIWAYRGHFQSLFASQATPSI